MVGIRSAMYNAYDRSMTIDLEKAQRFIGIAEHIC